MSQQYLEQVAKHIGSEKVCYADTLGENVSQFRPRKSCGSIHPTSVDDVEQLIDLASHHEGIKLHPVSTGFNWGLGSKEDVTDGRVLVSMSGLNNIRQLNLAQGYAVIEPGVSQGELAAKLKDEAWMINLTASSAHSKAEYFAILPSLEFDPHPQSLSSLFMFTFYINIMIPLKELFRLFCLQIQLIQLMFQYL